MKLRHLLLGTACALGSVTAANAATGWYLGLGAGWNWLEDGDITEIDTGVVDDVNDFDWEDGYIVAGAVGYDFGRWRAEFEVAHRDNDANSFCRTVRNGVPQAVPPCLNAGSTDVWELSQMVNVLYDIDLGGRWEASVGAGIGGNLVVLTAGRFDNSASGLDGDDYVLAGQLIAQAAYRVSERWQLYLDYRFMLNDDAEIQDPTDPLEVWEVEKTEHSLLLGFRFDLQRDGMAPPPPAPTPAPPPRQPKQFIVFFGFNKSNLTPEAARVVADAAAAAKEYGSASIMVVGHTDTVGSNSYNNALSMRRSHAVKDGLVAQGIPANAISTAGRGESELMVQTGDGVKEPQNRRATVDLN